MGNRQKTYDAIVRLAWQLFIKKGYQATPTRAITDELNLAEGTLFAHFPTKIALLETCLENAFSEVLSQAKETDIQRSARMKINHYAQYFYQFYCHHHEFYKVLFTNKLFEASFQKSQIVLINQLVFVDQPSFNKVKASIMLDCYFMTLIQGLANDEPDTRLMLKTLSQKIALL